MSDIWHKAGFHEAIDDKLKVSRDGKWVYWTMYGWNIAGEDAHDIGCEWAYLDDLLACEQELDRTRKALDAAVDALKEISLKYQNELDKPVAPAKWFSAATDMCDFADNALEQIESITKGE